MPSLTPNSLKRPSDAIMNLSHKISKSNSLSQPQARYREDMDSANTDNNGISLTTNATTPRSPIVDPNLRTLMDDHVASLQDLIIAVIREERLFHEVEQKRADYNKFRDMPGCSDMVTNADKHLERKDKDLTRLKERTLDARHVYSEQALLENLMLSPPQGSDLMEGVNEQKRTIESLASQQTADRETLRELQEESAKHNKEIEELKLLIRFSRHALELRQTEAFDNKACIKENDDNYKRLAARVQMMETKRSNCDMMLEAEVQTRKDERVTTTNAQKKLASDVATLNSRMSQANVKIAKSEEEVTTTLTTHDCKLSDLSARIDSLTTPTSLTIANLDEMIAQRIGEDFASGASKDWFVMLERKLNETVVRTVDELFKQHLSTLSVPEVEPNFMNEAKKHISSIIREAQSTISAMKAEFANLQVTQRLATLERTQSMLRTSLDSVHQSQQHFGQSLARANPNAGVAFGGVMYASPVNQRPTLVQPRDIQLSPFDVSPAGMILRQSLGPAANFPAAMSPPDSPSLQLVSKMAENAISTANSLRERYDKLSDKHDDLRKEVSALRSRIESGASSSSFSLESRFTPPWEQAAAAEAMQSMSRSMDAKFEKVKKDISACQALTDRFKGAMEQARFDNSEANGKIAELGLRLETQESAQIDHFAALEVKVSELRGDAERSGKRFEHDLLLWNMVVGTHVGNIQSAVNRLEHHVSVAETDWQKELEAAKSERENDFAAEMEALQGAD